MKFNLPTKEEKVTKGLMIKIDEELLNAFTIKCKKIDSNKTRILTAFIEQFVKEV